MCLFCGLVNLISAYSSRFIAFIFIGLKISLLHFLLRIGNSLIKNGVWYLIESIVYRQLQLFPSFRQHTNTALSFRTICDSCQFVVSSYDLRGCSDCYRSEEVIIKQNYGWWIQRMGKDFPIVCLRVHFGRHYYTGELLSRVRGRSECSGCKRCDIVFRITPNVWAI